MQLVAPFKENVELCLFVRWWSYKISSSVSYRTYQKWLYKWGKQQQTSNNCVFHFQIKISKRLLLIVNNDCAEKQIRKIWYNFDSFAKDLTNLDKNVIMNLVLDSGMTYFYLEQPYCPQLRLLSVVPGNRRTKRYSYAIVRHKKDS